jgi:hypothetical protein
MVAVPEPKPLLEGRHIGVIIDENFEEICGAVPKARAIVEEYLPRINAQREATDTAYEQEVFRVAMAQGDAVGIGGNLHLVEFKQDLLRQERAIVEEFHARMSEAIATAFTVELTDE